MRSYQAPLFENLVGRSTLPPSERVGAQYDSLTTLNALRSLWATLYLPLLLLFKNSFIKGSFWEIFYNYFEAYSEPCHLNKIELFVIVNRWEALNIFQKKLHLVYFIGLWMSLCVLVTVYVMAKKYMEVRQINWQER